ncbi:MAG: ATP-binding cassette domain-containing protein [Planctomycetes bacterium]|nr:ATP-binding cassette domain-containing protein [Planctomycetota bacterium]
MGPAVRVAGLRKSFRVRERAPGLLGAFRSLLSATTREVVAVDALSFQIAAGERVAFIGPNGAGKSTTLKVLSGILHPTAGDVEVLGLVPWRDRREVALRIGTVFGQRSQLWSHLPAGDTFDLLAYVYDQDPATHRRRRAELADVFGIGPLLTKPVRQLSLGERMRCELVASLLHAPRVLFLDEPTIGLDVSAKAAIRDLVRRRADEDGCAVILTSHDTGDMERVCDRAIVIHRGRLLLDEPVHSLRRFIRRKVVTLATAEPDVVLDLPGLTIVERAPHRTVIEVDVTVTPVEAVVHAALAVTRLNDLSVEDPPMEEIVAAIYASADAGGAAVKP